jgi:hypothetical protein
MTFQPVAIKLECLCGCGARFGWTRVRPHGPTPKWIPSHRPGTRRKRINEKNIPRCCGECGRVFVTTPSAVRRGHGAFCSRPCMYAWRRSAPRTAVPASIRQLDPGEHVPASEPRRYRSAAGYIRLRWKVGPHAYVETYEHRVVAGIVATDVIHHVNGDRADNDSSNLRACTHQEHAALHGLARRRFDRSIAAAMFVAGKNMSEIARAFDVNPTTVLRGLRAAGISTGHVLRPMGVGREDAATVRFERMR